MKNKQKLFLGIATVIIAAGFFSAKVSALTMPEILSQPKILGASVSALFPYPTASLVKDKGTIYFISGTTKIPFVNMKAFSGLGYSLKNVVKGDLSNYTMSQSYFIKTAKDAHPWGSWISYKGAVYFLTQNGMVPVPSSEVFLSNGGKWNLVVKANKYDLAILNSNRNLPSLVDNDPQIMGQLQLQFSGPSSQNNQPIVLPPSLVPVVPTSTPVVPTTTPVAAPVFSATSSVPQIILPANVYASSTAVFSVNFPDPNTPLYYTFSWGDGTPTNSVAVSSVSHIYYTAGSYVIGVLVTDNSGNSYTSNIKVQVTPPPIFTPSAPQISFSPNVVVQTDVTVAVSSSDPQSLPLTYVFSWGDGTPDTVAALNSATHNYAYSDTFPIKVTVYDTQGYSNSSSAYLFVKP